VIPPECVEAFGSPGEPNYSVGTAGSVSLFPSGARKPERTMPSVDIEYCVPCGMRDRAVEVQTAILEQFGRGVENVALVTGDDGTFEVRVDGDLVFDKSEEYDVDDIVDAVGEHVGAAA